MEGLTKRYGGTVALDGLTAQVRPGLIGLVGANGAGKTTLFRLVLGLTQPTSGRVEVDGIDVADDPIGVRRRVGYMPEHDCLPLDQTAADVVSTFAEMGGLPVRDARQRASDVLDLVGLDEARFRSIGTFSTGMRQRAKLAQAIVGGPVVVLLDEPTAGLDPVGRDEMLDLISRLGTFGISVIMSTHLLDDVARVCDQVVMISAGSLVVAGSTEALLARTGRLLVDVGRRHPDLVGALQARGVRARSGDDVAGDHGLTHDLVEVDGDGDATVDEVLAVIADLGLPLYRLSSGSTSLDDVFLSHAERAR